MRRWWFLLARDHNRFTDLSSYYRAGVLLALKPELVSWRTEGSNPSLTFPS